ncbi:DUF418 domain-containing protein [Altericroceibacterium spongiae]|uniref:DUF418 domain-containing protein n=1 Tax=Altericroceibacterium spongiae TaxID=2320269 RepID=A0A420EK13_9SPHN|nr:DUF418 domain-containing protein [Altericroceibacterium spongiae]RKF21062.1 DUF418 domain-containing protein [Altericroceibacterium spongiae]
MTSPEQSLDMSEDDTLPERPVRGAERLVSLDFIRGVAVLGILFANITAFAHPMLAYSWPDALPGGATLADDAIWLFQFVFIDGKFRALFSLLFGAGMMLFMERVWARGGSRWLQARRLFLLMLFGLAHFYLLFVGDILFLYSIAGLLVLPMLCWSAERQFWSGLVWYLLGALILTGLLAMPAVIEAHPAAAPDQWQTMMAGWQDRIDEAARETSVMQQGSYGDIVAFRFAEQSGQLAELLIVVLFETAPLMVLGMALYRRGFFMAPLDSSQRLLWSVVALIGGVLLSLPLGLWAIETGFPPFLTQFLFNGPSAFPRLAVSLGMAGLLTLWAPVCARSWLGSRVIAAGRMAFSNYVGTSALMLLIFQGWAGGLYGDLHRMALLPIVLLGWIAMLGWSKSWLTTFRYGPLEWLWRCLAYGKAFNIKR